VRKIKDTFTSEKVDVKRSELILKRHKMLDEKQRRIMFGGGDGDGDGDWYWY
jgi:hypothetical protein